MDSEAHGKRLLFRFRRKQDGVLLWLGLHLGMTGKLRCLAKDHGPEKHDHLVLNQKERSLVFSDTRQFGRIDFAAGDETPLWWRGLPPPILSDHFTRERVEAFLERHRRTSIKGVLLMQDGFPGLGNWMVDEILWRSGIAPARPAGEMEVEERKRLFRVIRFVCRTALDTIGRDYRDPPSNWLFHRRWTKGEICPRTGELLRFDQIAGRTTCWSPGLQR